jgi:hypothetical protein
VTALIQSDVGAIQILRAIRGEFLGGIPGNDGQPLFASLSLPASGPRGALGGKALRISADVCTFQAPWEESCENLPERGLTAIDENGSRSRGES